MSFSESSNEMVMPVAPMYGSGSNNGGIFGNGNDGWWIILLFILLGGWGGYGNGGGTGAMNNYVLNSDMAMLERRTDTIINGLCDGFYTQAQLINGVQSQMASCCCDIREGISGINYNMAMNANATQNAICNSSRDIIESQTAGTNAILKALNDQAIEAKNTRIAELERELQMASLAASQSAQTAYLEAKLGPTASCPIPAYVVPNPNCCNSCGC